MINEGEVAAEVLRWFEDPASRRFDEVLARTSLSVDQQRELRYWQRQSLQAVKRYAAETVPAVLSAVHAARRDAEDQAASAADTWAGVRRAAAVPTDAAEPPAVPRVPSAEPAPGIAMRLAAVPSADDALETRRRNVAARLATGS
jgi:hypothetical protein